MRHFPSGLVLVGNATFDGLIKHLENSKISLQRP
jgi:hypothetical protein